MELVQNFSGRTEETVKSEFPTCGLEIEHGTSQALEGDVR